MTACRYPYKMHYESESEARFASEEIRARVHGRGQRFIPLYPYQCPENEHWHLSSSRQGTATCPRCDTPDLSAWFDHRRNEWVIYAHGDCPIQAGVTAVADV